MVCIVLITSRGATLSPSDTSSTDFSEGKFTPDLTIPTTSLEEEEENLEGDEKVAFLRFLRKMLRWLPEERESARELMKDPWLQIG